MKVGALLRPGAPVWNRTSISCSSGRRHHQIGFESKIAAGDQRGVSCPATGIVDYLIVKDHPQPSPEWLPRFIEASESCRHSGRRLSVHGAALFAVPRGTKHAQKSKKAAAG